MNLNDLTNPSGHEFRPNERTAGIIRCWPIDEFTRILNHEEKLTKILNPSTLEQIRTVMSFIRQSLELREGDSSVIIAVHVIVFFLCSHA